MHDPVVYLAPAPRQAVVPAPDLEHLYRLFSDLCLHGPTPLQPRLLEEAEAIWQTVYAPRPAPPDPDTVARTRTRAQAFCRRLRAEYPVLRAERVGGGEAGKFVLAPSAPVALARGLPRAVLLELVNRGPDPVAASVGQDPRAAGTVQTVPAGESVLALLVLTARPETRRHLEVVVCPPGAHASAVSFLQIPVRVSAPARLVGTLRDGGRVTPGRVRVVGSDRHLRHGVAYAGIATVSEKPVVFRPSAFRLPFFYSDGRYEVLVPPGRTTVSLERGCEHPVVARTLVLKPGETRRVDLSSSRFRDMRAQGWISADTHVHWVKNSWDVNESLSLLGVVQRAEDVRVVNNLTLYQWRPAAQGGAFVKPDHHPMGPVPGMCGPEWHVQMGEELRNDNHYGHVNLLGIRSRIEPLATGPGSGGPPDAIDFPLNATAIREARRQGGISVEAHDIGPFHAGDTPVHVALGLADSLDQIDPERYYRFLNCGFHIGLTNGSDHPARVLGIVRAYVRVDGPFTYERWLDGVRAGRTFTTSGPLVGLRAHTASIGESADVARGAPVTVTAWALSRRPLGRVEIVSNGDVVASRRTDAKHLTLSVTLPADRSRWFCVRVSAGRSFQVLDGPDIAHSSAAWVRVDGREVVRRDDVAFWRANVAIHRERVEKLGNFADAAQRAAALAHVDAGAAVYERLWREAGEGPGEGR